MIVLNEARTGELWGKIKSVLAGKQDKLVSIEITTPPDKTHYGPGEVFDPAGMVVTATYAGGASVIATGWQVFPSGPLPMGLESVTVRYTEGGVSVTASQSVSTPWLYGYDIDLDTAAPADRVSYPDGVFNAGFAKAAMDFDAGAFSYGGWPSTPGEKFMPRPCMLNFDGTVAYYLDPDDYTKKADGTDSDVANVDFGGNAMMEWPKIYAKRWEEDGVYHFRCSNVKVDGDYECWSNYDINNNEIPHFYTPIFFGSRDSSGRMRSISGRANVMSNTAQQEIDAAKLNGADIWYTEVLADRQLINDLLVMLYKSTNLQAAAGMGVVNAGSPAAPGTMNTRGMFWGADYSSAGVKVFGMEHYWGNLYRRVAGWMYVDGVQKVKLTRGARDGTAAADYNITGDGYLTVDGSAISGTSGSYISGMKTERYGRFPKTLSGYSTGYEADACYYNNSGTKYAAVSGMRSSNLIAGPFYASFAIAPDSTPSAAGAALSCKPLAGAQV